MGNRKSEVDSQPSDSIEQAGCHQAQVQGLEGANMEVTREARNCLSSVRSDCRWSRQRAILETQGAESFPKVRVTTVPQTK